VPITGYRPTLDGRSVALQSGSDSRAAVMSWPS